MSEQIERLLHFYETEKALVTSPFIQQTGFLDRRLLQGVFGRLGIGGDFEIVVDIGCGSGLLSTFFTDAALYVGVDIVSHPTFSRYRDERHRFIRADAQYPSLASGSADILMCLDSFEHYPQPQLAAHEFFRVLKPDGVLFLSAPNYANVAGLVKKYMERYGGYGQNTWAPFDFWKPEELEHFITPKRVKRLFRSAGFSKFEMMGYDREVAVGLFPWVWHPKMPGKLERAIRLLFYPVSKPIVYFCPTSSLHTFWKITK